MDFAYYRQSIGAAFRLAARDHEGLKQFDLSAEGFFRSFAAFAFVVPLNILFDLFMLRLLEAKSLSEGKADALGSYGLPELLFSTATLGIEWLIFPIAAIFLLRFLNLSDRYATLIIAHNWGRIVTGLFNLPTIVLFSLGLISHQVAFDLLFITFGLTLYYRFYITQTALEVGWSLAMAITIIEILLMIFFAEAVWNSQHLWIAP